MDKDIEVVSNQIIELSQKILSLDVSDDYIKLVERYNSYLYQFIQLLSGLGDEERMTSHTILNVKENHMRLEDKLKADKAGIKLAILKLNSDLSLKKKYYSHGVESIGINKEC